MLLRAVAEAARDLDLVGRPVLVAVSGGVDSTVLAHALRALSEILRLNLSIGHVNHCLRGVESEADQAFVCELGRCLDVPVWTERVEPLRLREGVPSRGRPTLQEAARRLRYDALGRLAEAAGASRIATAHTADDQAETVLLRLLRGSGPEGLAGIPRRSRDGVVVRPLLRVARDEIVAFATAHAIAWREDPSNANPRFGRARLRARWMPALRADFNPRLLRAIGDLAEAQREELTWIEELVEREAGRRFVREDARTLRIDAKGWDVVPEALARRLARHALRESGAARDVTRAHLVRMVRFLRDGRVGRRLELPGGRVLVREREGFRLTGPGLPPVRTC